MDAIASGRRVSPRIMYFQKLNFFRNPAWNLSRRVWLCALALALLGAGLKLAAPPSRAQAGFGGVFNNFQIPETDNLGRKSVLKGASGARISPTQLRLTGVILELFRSTGELELQVKAPECIYDTSAKIASSTGALSVETADGRFSIQGTGFRWQQSDSRLIISNQVETVIRKAMLTAAATPLAPPVAALPSQPAAENPAPDIIEIFSDHFDYTSDLAMFRGNVRALEPGQGELTCGLLAVTFSGNALQKIVAEQNVVIAQKDGRATGKEAVYHLEEERVILTGDPTWTINEAEGKSRILTLNRKTQEFRAEQDVFMKAPVSSFIPAELFPSTEPADTEASPQTPQWIEFVADEFSFKTNTAQFRGNVQVTQTGGRLTCGLLNLISSSPQGPVEEMIAEENVHIVQGKTEAHSGRAHYLSSEDTLTLTGQPKWVIDSKTGSSDQLTIHPQSRRFEALGNVSVQLPATEAASLGLQFASSETPSSAPPEQPSPEGRTIQIQADELEHQEYFTLFYGNVLARDERVELTSRFLTVLYASGEVTEIEADEEVRILEGAQTVTGGNALYDVTAGIVTLTGDPQLITPNGKFFADVFLLDRIHNTFRTRGNYRFEGSSATFESRRKDSASY
jgi:lipopolysaccharide export system protein LptA